MDCNAFSQASNLSVQASRQGFHVLPGSEIEPQSEAYIIGPPKPSRLIQVTLLLRSRRQPAQEHALSADAMGVLSPLERPYLSRAELAGSYGADPADVQVVTRFANQTGLQVVGGNLAARTVFLSGTVANFSRAFRTPLAVYRSPRGVYRGRTGPVMMPQMLNGIVLGVFGLDNRPIARPHFRRQKQLGGAWARALGVSYSPDDIARLYNFPSDADGAGECIGIIELGGGFRRGDLVQYFRNLGIAMPQVRKVLVGGAQNRPTQNPNGPDGEVMLDIEVAGAVAPGARIVVYFSHNTDQGFLRAVHRAIHDNVHRPSVISISWGGPESAWTRQSLNAFNQAFESASLIGVTVCAAAGDSGATDGVPGKLAHVDFPASSPYVIGCGGTHIESSGESITSETVWNDGAQGGAGGGGVSDFFALPQFQKNANVPHSVNPGNRIGRGVPDVSANADENTGYKVRVDGLDTVIGGTSAVAPLMAGLVARLNEKLGTPVGYLNPLLYTTLADSFNDVTVGNIDMTGLLHGNYKAAKGWDAASGLGSPDGGKILTALGVPAEELLVELNDDGEPVTAELIPRSLPKKAAASKRVKKTR